ncbi:hypothetical protein [Luteibacter sp. 9135]|uniref:hypothetical protein n=1 Tax=Luteibacter sp. 9135 TaxID=1500893 RepID=UPI00056C78E1|nr:hypothetical protein [Luteibacter sp. 9135]
MDMWVWSRGLDQWITDPYWSKTTVPHELDYLRGMHNSRSLDVLANWLTKKVGVGIRLRTMWQDKHVYVRPTGGKQRELADIAVIAQRIKPGNAISRVMWLLQAKVVETPISRFTGASSKKEIELFEGNPGAQTPGFELLKCRGGSSIASFPAGAFGGPAHWSFLTLHRDPKVPVHEAMRDRWPSSHATGPLHRSFCGSLIDMINGGRGVPVLLPSQPGDHWSRLFEVLMKQPLVATVGHARSAANPSGVVMQFSALQLAAHNAVDNRLRPYYRYPRRYRPSMTSSRILPWTSEAGIKELSLALEAEAFGEDGNFPPDHPLALLPPDEQGPGFPLTVFIDIDGDER